MAIAKVTLTCSTCGKDFEHRKDCWNRRDADSYEEWAKSHIDTCPECYKKHIASEKAERLSAVLEECGYQLPTLTGVSDKQTAYADTVRTRYLADSLDKIRQYHEGMQAFEDAAYKAKFDAQCADLGLTPEEGINQSLKNARLDKVHLLLTSSSARDVLDSIAR